MALLIEHMTTALKEARKAKGLNQTELGRRVGLPQSHISKIERGQIDIKLSSLIELARALDLELTLVPRKLVPAVKSIIRNAVTHEISPPLSSLQLTGHSPNIRRSAYSLDDDDG